MILFDPCRTIAADLADLMREQAVEKRVEVDIRPVGNDERVPVWEETGFFHVIRVLFVVSEKCTLQVD